MPFRFNCNSCDFSFFSGWFHHNRDSGLVCLNCSQKYWARGKLNEWGPLLGEKLSIYCRKHLSKRRGYAWRPTGLFVYAIKTNEIWEGKEFEIIKANPTHLRCTKCKVEGSIVDSLQEGQSCPKCHKGFIGPGSLIIQ